MTTDPSVLTEKKGLYNNLSEFSEKCPQCTMEPLLVDEEDVAKMEDIFKRLGFFNEDREIDPEKDGVFFYSNEEKEPHISFRIDLKDSLGDIATITPQIGIYYSHTTCTLRLAIYDGDWNLVVFDGNVGEFERPNEAIELAQCFSDILGKQLNID